MSLKDAMMKAGLKSSKTQNMRKAVTTRDKKKIEKHQEIRNFCEVCQLIQPDVERYVHKNPTVDAEWICAACADKEEIHDQFRMTNQSEFAKGRRFRREFGPTKDFSDNSSTNKKSSHRSPVKKKEEVYKEADFSVDDDGEKNFNC
ncbi:hypothetical protein A9Q84_06565 [Halobacteriovorax marinus]|uniref:Uncharacterized protein n=1 Tax=Halobacteriovorax marinus TaxID=97084 RepID=A0A1Y5F9Q7_9BACT|nr:hypothetical protein A9Q84_06565 [Halobacteriovorax marinus]